MSKRIFSSCSPLLLAAVAGCALFSPPAGLDLRLTRPSENQAYIVAMRPLERQVTINRLHAWEIRITSAAGVPVTHAQIAFDGGMPQHGHGFPTSPRVTEELGDGRYRLDGMKFSMGGWWQMNLTIKSAAGADKVSFNTVIAAPLAPVAGTVAQTVAGMP
jgi:hypothetical protein